MLFATVNGEKVDAIPKTKGICPLCDKEVFSKCGEIYVWHWAHLKDESCDSWYEPETEWHKNWKLIFGKNYCEIIIKKDGVKHIADVQTNGGVIIELQNSPIQKPIVRKRENFYGEKMLWVINGNHFKHNFNIYSSQLNNNHLSRTTKDAHYFGLYNPLLKHHVIIDSNEEKSKYQSENDVRFSWSRPRRTWDDVLRPVFIDFGDENLFWVKDGMGRSWGEGRQISKEKFITKYGGDVTLLPTIIQKSN